MDGARVSDSQFDPAIFGGQAVMLHIDQSARYYPIERSTGDVRIDGNHWLDRGAGTIWGADVAPRVAVPDPG